MMMDENFGLLDKRSAGARRFAREVMFQEREDSFDLKVYDGVYAFTDYDDDRDCWLVGDGSEKAVVEAYNEILKDWAEELDLDWYKLLEEYTDEVKCEEGFKLPEGWKDNMDHYHSDDYEDEDPTQYGDLDYPATPWGGSCI